MPLFTRKFHAWAGISISLFIFLLSVTGLLLLYPSFLYHPTSSSDPLSQHPHYYYQASNEDIYIATDYLLYHTSPSSSDFQPLTFPSSAKDIVAIAAYQDRLYVALKTGLLFSSIFPHDTWQRHLLPHGYALHSMQVRHDRLWVSTNEGLFYLNNDHWVPFFKHTSSSTLYDMIKALHTGYLPFSWLKLFYTLSTIGLIGLIFSGIVLFFKGSFKKNT